MRADTISLASQTELFLSTVRRLSDTELADPSLLPGWTRAHVVAHVHHNAQALGRLVSWAATGVRSDMYVSPEQRDAEIEATAKVAPVTLRTAVETSAVELTDALGDLSHEAWTTEVVTAQGRTVPATEIVWMRTREVAVHAVDLGGATKVGDLSDDTLVMLARDALERRITRGETGPIAAWLIGRGPAPTLPAWL